MQEVIPRVIQFGFEEMKLETIEAEVEPAKSEIGSAA